MLTNRDDKRTLGGGGRDSRRAHARGVRIAVVLHRLSIDPIHYAAHKARSSTIQPNRVVWLRAAALRARHRHARTEIVARIKRIECGTHRSWVEFTMKGVYAHDCGAGLIASGGPVNAERIDVGRSGVFRE